MTEAADTCRMCQENDTGGPKTIVFTHQGFVFTVFKSGLECSACVRRKYRELFNEVGPELIQRRGLKRFSVNWRAYHEAQRGGDFEGRAKKMFKLLCAVGILSYDAQGNWEIVAGRSSLLSPRSRGDRPLYFTRKRDAEEFARTGFSDSIYRWELRKISRVISKTEVLSREQCKSPLSGGFFLPGNFSMVLPDGIFR